MSVVVRKILVVVGAALLASACGESPAADGVDAAAAPDSMVDAIPPRDVGYSPPDARIDPPTSDGGLRLTGLFAVSRDDVFLRQLEPTTGQVLGAVRMTVSAGAEPVGLNGLAADPTDDTLYVLIKQPGSSGRVLATVDPVSGSLTIIGDTGDRFASLAFDGTGVLYGITGRGAATPSAVFSLDKDTAAATMVQQLGVGDDGEAIAWNAGVGFMYHATGMTDAHLEAIDLDTVTLDLPYDTEGPGEVLAFTWMPTLDLFLVAAQNGSGDVSLSTVSSLAEVSSFSAELVDFHVKGLAFISTTSLPTP